MRRNSETRSAGTGSFLIFGIIWTAFSSIFVFFGLREAFIESKVQIWVEVPCAIEKFEITASRKKDPPFRPKVLFTYIYEGKNREGRKLWREKEGVDKYEDLAELREQLWATVDARCRVNPETPDEAVLVMDQEGLWGGLAFAVFGGCFVLVGVGMIVASVRGRNAPKAVTAKDDEEMGGLLGCGFFGVFALAGLAILFGVVAPTAVEYLRMKGWVEAPAEVIWSRVQSHSSDDGTTYSVDVFYKYKLGDQEFRSNRWKVFGGSSSGRSGKQEVVEAHPRGTQFVCYVNPDKPWQAVANRKLGWSALFGLFPLPFIAVGVGGLWYTFVRKRKKLGSVKSKTEPKSSRLRKEMKESPKGKSTQGRRVLVFVGACFFALFWNGITWVGVVIAWKGWQKGQGEWVLSLFMIPFVLVGILLIVHAVYRCLAIFSPVYEVTWDDERPEPGGRLKLSWERTGGGGRPRQFAIWLVGQEEATYRRGSNTSTATSVFHESVLFETESLLMMSSGTCDLVIPEDAVPSFKGEHNKLRWFVRLIAEVPMRPDVNDEHELEVGNPKQLRP